MLVITLVAYTVFRIKLKKVKAAAAQQAIQQSELLSYAQENEQKAREEAKQVILTKRQLMARMSHDVRSPLNGVIGMVALLKETSLTTEQLEYCETIRSCGETLLATLDEVLVEDIHAPSKAESGKRALDKEFGWLKQEGETITTKELFTKQKLSPDFSQHHPLRILIAEDDRVNQQLMVRILGKLGYTPDVAQNGKEVLEIVSQTKYDVVLMDVQMPEMDGLEATRMIRLCLNVQPIIIAMTANAMQGDREACINAGMDDYISKPVNMEELMILLEKAASQIITKQ
jgi:CheY-like chemotaxis protein